VSIETIGELSSQANIMICQKRLTGELAPKSEHTLRATLSGFSIIPINLRSIIMMRTSCKAAAAISRHRHASFHIFGEEI
jgi:hypothetical protein